MECNVFLLARAGVANTCQGPLSCVVSSRSHACWRVLQQRQARFLDLVLAVHEVKTRSFRPQVGDETLGD